MEDNHLERFDEIAKEMCELHRAKDADYGNSFGETFRKLGIISAVTRISDKYNRLVNLSTKRGEANVDESLEDTLKDMAAYAIMTIVELENQNKEISNEIENILNPYESPNLTVGKMYRARVDFPASGVIMTNKGRLYEAISKDCIKCENGTMQLTKDNFDKYFEY